MPRRISSGKVGRSVLGDIFTQDNSLQSVLNDTNIVLQPSGTGIVESLTDIQTSGQSGIRFADSDSTNYVLIRAPATISSNVTLTLPVNDGNASQVLITDGSGALSFGDATVGITNTISDSSTYYPTLTTATTGGVTGINVSNTKLNFVPSTGMLTTTGLTATTATISGGTINNTSVGATTASTGRFTTITETSSITLKENINPINNALDKIMELAGVIYDRKDGSSKREAGLIAEDVNQVLPNLVNKDVNGNPESIQYTKLSVYLIEAVKTLSEEIKILQGKK